MKKGIKSNTLSGMFEFSCLLIAYFLDMKNIKIILSFCFLIFYHYWNRNTEDITQAY